MLSKVHTASGVWTTFHLKSLNVKKIIVYTYSYEMDWTMEFDTYKLNNLGKALNMLDCIDEIFWEFK